MDELTVSEQLENKINKIKFLGQGAWSDVYAGVIMNNYMGLEEGLEVAIKTPITPNEDIMERYKREANIHKFLSKNNANHIINYYGLDTFLNNEAAMIVELGLTNGSTHIIRLKRENKLIPSMQRILSNQVCDAFIELHSIDYKGKTLLFNDPSWKNLILTKDVILKLGDLGSVKEVGLYPEIRRLGKSSRSTHGNDLYCAPETMAEDGVRKIYSLESDIYGIGMMLFELYAGNLPFTQDKSDQSKTQLARNKFSATYIDNAVNSLLRGKTDDFRVDAIRKAIDPEPDLRFSSVLEFKDAMNAPMKKDPFIEYYKQIEDLMKIKNNYTINDIKPQNIYDAITAFENMEKLEQNGHHSSLTQKAKTLLEQRAESDYDIISTHLESKEELKKSSENWSEHQKKHIEEIKKIMPMQFAWGNKFHDNFINTEIRINPSNKNELKQEIQKRYNLND